MALEGLKRWLGIGGGPKEVGVGQQGREDGKLGLEPREPGPGKRRRIREGEEGSPGRWRPSTLEKRKKAALAAGEQDRQDRIPVQDTVKLKRPFRKHSGRGGRK